MAKLIRPAYLAVVLVLAGVMASATTSAGEADQELRTRLEQLEQKLRAMQSIAAEVADLRRRLARSEANAQEAVDSAKAAEAKAKAVEHTAKAEDETDIKWHLGGFGTADFTHTDTSGEFDSFGTSFNPIFLVSWRDLLLFEGELEVTATTSGATKTELEFANLNLQARDWLTLTGGKFLSPIGDFQQHLHPSWINKLPDRPAGFVEDGGNEPLTEVGAMARGAFPLGSMTADYAVFVGNGPRLSDVADEGVLLEGFGGDINDDKAFGGRVGLRPLPYFNLGLSAMKSRVKGNPGASGQPTSSDYYVLDADAAFTRGPWDIRGEYIMSHLDRLATALDPVDPVGLIPATTWRSWYTQAAYRMAGLTDQPYLRNLEPVFRYSQFSVTGLDEFRTMEENRWTLGLDYWLAPSVVFKAAYLNRDFDNRENDDMFRLQFAFGF